jgi:HK97 family phage prohead protease
MAMGGIERRAAVELRSTGRSLYGYAARFGVETRIADFVEEVRQGAFARSLRTGADVCLLYDHDPGRPLARVRAATLRLSEDAHGLHFETSDLPNVSWANDTLELVRSNTHGGCSFGFICRKDAWEGNKRTLVDVDLHEISVVAFQAAYSDTSVSVRRRMPPRLARALRVLQTV